MTQRLPHPHSADAHLERIRQEVVNCDVYRLSDDNLRSAPSDALDGWAFAREVKPLIDRRILMAVPVEPENRTLGNKVTWLFTDKGMALARSWLAASAPASGERASTGDGV